LPESYGTKKLLLAARDPNWLYAHWDLTREQQQNYNAQSCDNHLVLRIFVDATGGEPLTHVHLHADSDHWFVHIPYAGTKYQAELGFFSRDGAWQSISTSGTAITPPDAPSKDISALFATIPLSLPLAQLKELARATTRENIPLSEVLQQLQLYSQENGGGGQWTPEREEALAELIALDASRHVWVDSFGLAEAVRRQLPENISSEAAAQFSAPVPAGISSETRLPAAVRSFWFNVNAELVIYGATEPDARVTIAGRSVKLRPDGSFSFRYSLPDGQYQLSASAVSADATDGRSVQLKFARHTDYHGDVGRHPQDPTLRPPPVTDKL